MHCAAFATRRRHGVSAASESAAAQTSAATQLSAEAALARAAVSDAQSENHFEESTSIDATRHGHHERRTCIAQQARAATGMASRRRARAFPADEHSDAADCLGVASSSRGQRRAERGSFRGEHDHRRAQHGRHERRRVHRAASASRRRHGEPAAKESAAWRTSAATQPSAEAALAQAEVSSEQSEGHFEESTSMDGRRSDAMGDAACIAQRARAAAGLASRRQTRAPPRGRAQ